MKLKQITISIENEPGRLLEVTEALGNAGINLRALNLVDTGAFGQLRLCRRYGDPNDLCSIPLCGIAGQAPSPATDIQNPLAALQANLAADKIELRLLRLVQ